jgi:hypothetical protein
MYSDPTELSQIWAHRLSFTSISTTQKGRKLKDRQDAEKINKRLNT